VALNVVVVGSGFGAYGARMIAYTLLRDLLDGIGALVQSIGKVALVLAIGGTPFYILWLASRSAEHQRTPPIFWQAIPITWLACALVWQLGSLLRSLAYPNRTRRRAGLQHLAR